MNQMTEPTGVLLLDKPAGMTSHDCVAKIRRLYGTKKVGHTGTLDPMATGVLPILLGRTAKAADFLLAEDKIYFAGLKLGLTTDTEDVTGTVLTQTDDLPNEAAVRAACETMLGEQFQTPPMYSALKVNGQKLVDLARRGITVEREARPIRIFSIAVEAGETPADYSLLVHCSKGTYIRTLCADIGKKLGCGGVMSSLERRQTGRFQLGECVRLETLESMTPEERSGLLRPTESLFEDLPKVTLPPFFEKLARSGCEIYQKKIGTAFDEGERVSVYGKDGFFALGEVCSYPDGSAVKVLKLFSL